MGNFLTTYNNSHHQYQEHAAEEIFSSNNRHHQCLKLPNEIYIEILSRVPADDLVIYMTVCRIWYAIIKDPYFVKLHTGRAPISTMVIASYNRGKLRTPNNFVLGDEDTILSSTKGLLCVKLNPRLYGICNPSNYKFLPLPALPREGERVGMKLYSILSTQELKVVAVSNLKDHRRRPCWYILNIGRGVTTWKAIKLPPCLGDDTQEKFHRHYLYDHGVHCFRKSTRLGLSMYELFSLDMENEEVIDHSPLPWIESLRNEIRINFTDWDGYFATVLYWFKGGATSKMKIWMLEDHKNSKWVTKIVLSPFRWDRGRSVQSILFARDDKIYCTKDKTKIFSFDLKKEERRDYGINVRKLSSVFPHISTLERMEGMK